MIMNVAEKPRETFVLNRGQYDQPLELVEPGTPEQLGVYLAEPAHPNRLGLAKWMVQPNHPLTARVAVNRIWQLLFGEGIVRSSADFGSQGTPPTHPYLLDHPGGPIRRVRLGRKGVDQRHCDVCNLSTIFEDYGRASSG